MNFAKFLRTSFFTEHLWWLLLTNGIVFLCISRITRTSIFKRRINSVNIVGYALFLDIQRHSHTKFIGRLSFTTFVKISKGKIDAIIYPQASKKDGKISEDICLLFDEMYLQKCEEYFGGEQIGSKENEELYKVIICSLVL